MNSIKQLKTILALYKNYEQVTVQEFQDRIKNVVAIFGVDEVAEKLGKSRSTVQMYCKKAFIDRNRGFKFDSYIGLCILELELQQRSNKDNE